MQNLTNLYILTVKSGTAKQKDRVAITSFVGLVNKELKRTKSIYVSTHYVPKSNRFIINYCVAAINGNYNSTFDSDQIHYDQSMIETMKLVKSFIEEIRVEIGSHLVKSYGG
jgi:hypothetical protein